MVAPERKIGMSVELSCWLNKTYSERLWNPSRYKWSPLLSQNTLNTGTGSPKIHLIQGQGSQNTLNTGTGGPRIRLIQVQ